MNDELSITIQVDIYQDSRTGGPLSLRQQFNIRQCDFTEACRILGEFDTLAKKIKQERGK